jgi:hypothetical protein
LFILTQPQTGASGQSLTGSITGDSNSGVIPAGDTVLLDTVDSTARTVKWFIEIADSTNEIINSFEIYAVNFFGNSISFDQRGFVSNGIITHLVDVVYDGSNNMSLQVKNNTSIQLDYRVVRFEVI